MKTVIGAILAALWAYISPVSLTLLVVGMAIGARTGFEIWRIKKTQSRGRCAKINSSLWDMVKRMALYQFIAVTVLLIDREAAGDFVGLFTNIKLALTRGVACGLIILEIYFIDKEMKKVLGEGIAVKVKKAAGFVKKIKNEIKGIAPVFILGVMVSCSPVKRHYRIVEKFPYVHQQDTVVIKDTVRIQIKGFKVDTLVRIERLYDTLTIVKDGVTVVTYMKPGTEQVFQSIEQEAKEIIKTVYIKRPVIYYEKPLKWWQKIGVIFGLCIFSAGLGYFFKQRL